MSKKTKKVEDVNEELDNISEESEDGYYNATAYLPVYNDERKAYDMFLVRIDTINKKSFVEIEKVRYDSEARALQDVMKRYADEFIKGNQNRKKTRK